MSVPSNCEAVIDLQYLTIEEANQIHQQFHDPSFRQTRQVFWTGVTRQLAQKWADQRGMQTLTTAMGCLMQIEHRSCLKSKKTNKGWSKYLKGASAIFAHYAAEGQVITVLTPPPPSRFHPSGLTNFQVIEEPILKGEFGGSAVGRIELIHPGVPGAEDFRYEFWPTDKASSWIERFGMIPVKRLPWRQVKLRLYRSLGVNALEFTSGRDTAPNEVALQSRQGKELLSTQGVPSRNDGRVNVEVKEQKNPDASDFDQNDKEESTNTYENNEECGYADHHGEEDEEDEEDACEELREGVESDR